MLQHANLVAILLALSGTGSTSPAASALLEVPVVYDPSIVVEGTAPEHVRFNADEFLASHRLSPDFLANLTSFNPDAGSNVKRVIGADDRQAVPSQSWPWRPIGRVAGNGYACSGSMVGPRHVLTAKHCVGAGPMRFAPTFDYGEKLGGSNVVFTFGYDKPECDQASDFALLLLQDAIGPNTGWFAIREFLPASMLNTGIFGHAGYPGDRDGTNRMYGQAFISAHRTSVCQASRSISTNADVAGGQSGGPLWSWGAAGDNSVDVFGALSAASSVESTFAGGTALIQLWGEVRARWP